MTTLSVTSLAMAVWSALRRAVAKVRYALPLAEGTAPQSSVTKISGASGLSISGGDEFALGIASPHVDLQNYSLGVGCGSSERGEFSLGMAAPYVDRPDFLLGTSAPHPGVTR